MPQNNLAPVGLSTYIRLGHLQQTVAALQKNVLAEKTELFIFSDGPKKGDEAKVEAVRSYLKEITGFKKIHIFERTENNRVVNNRGGMAEVLEKYGRIIFLEEDLVTAPGFLLFMNSALKRYKDETKVFSITGWCPGFSETPLLAEGTCFFSLRFSAWGLGIWKDRFDKIKKISVEDVEALKQNKTAMARIRNQIGAGIFTMIQAEALGRTNALDVRCSYFQALTGGMTLHPFPTLARNIGLDGTGEHCASQLIDINGEFGDTIIDEFILPKDVLVNAHLSKISLEQHFEVNLFRQKIIGAIKKIGLHHYLRLMRERVQLKREIDNSSEV